MRRQRELVPYGQRRGRIEKCSRRSLTSKTGLSCVARRKQNETSEVSVVGDDVGFRGVLESPLEKK